MADAPPSNAVQASNKSIQTRAKQLGTFYIKGGPAPQDLSLQKKTFLKTSRYIFKFIFYRLLRYAKYALIGAGIAAIGTGIAGTAVSGLGMLLLYVIFRALGFFNSALSPSIPVGIGLGLATGAVKFGWRHSRFSKAFREGGEGDPRQDEQGDAEGVEEDKPTVWERL